MYWLVAFALGPLMPLWMVYLIIFRSIQTSRKSFVFSGVSLNEQHVNQFICLSPFSPRLLSHPSSWVLPSSKNNKLIKKIGHLRSSSFLPRFYSLSWCCYGIKKANSASRLTFRDPPTSDRAISHLFLLFGHLPSFSFFLLCGVASRAAKIVNQWKALLLGRSSVNC